MSANANAPVIIKRKKVIAGGGHHGGAWKVAYADFVTAMMAFFLLMWLLNATTEKQRKGIADYFSPTIPVNRISGGGEGSFGGDSVFTEETLAQNGTGASMKRPSESNAAKGSTGADPTDVEKAAEDAGFAKLEEAFTALSGESMVADAALRHIVTRVTDEGLIVELFDLPGEPLFAEDGITPTPLLRELAGAVVDVFGLVGNKVAINGYISARPVVLRNNPVWDISHQRADAMRRLLSETGLAPERLERITGYADRKPVVKDPMAPRNNRLEVILLRSESKASP